MVDRVRRWEYFPGFYSIFAYFYSSQTNEILIYYSRLLRSKDGNQSTIDEVSSRQKRGPGDLWREYLVLGLHVNFGHFYSSQIYDRYPL